MKNMYGIDPVKLATEVIKKTAAQEMKSQITEALRNEVSATVDVIINDMRERGTLHKMLVPVVKAEIKAIAENLDDLQGIIEEKAYEAIAEHLTTMTVRIEGQKAEIKTIKGQGRSVRR